MQVLADVADTSSSPHTGAEPLDGAATIASRNMRMMPPPAADGLRFDSRTIAWETTDRLFREHFEVDHDDVEEVEQNKRQHVKSLVNALNYKGFQSAPEHLMDRSGNMKNLTDEEKQELRNWDSWQQGACGHVEAHLVQPNVDTRVECSAWMVFDEIIKAHRYGHSLSNKTRDKHSKCSQRIKHALHNIKAFAIVRLKLLNCDKISQFATNPAAYALTTQRSHRNNAGRNAKESKDAGDAKASNANKATKPTKTTKVAKDGKSGGNGQPPTRRAAKKNGATARLYLTGAEVSRRKAEKADSDTETAASKNKQGSKTSVATATTNTNATRRSSLAEEQEAGILSRSQQFIVGPTAQLGSGLTPPSPGASFTQPTNFSFMDSLGPLPSTDNWSHTFTKTRTGHNANYGFNSRTSATADPFSGSPFETHSMPPPMRRRRRRADDTGEQSALEAAYQNRYGTGPNVGPAAPTQTNRFVPEDNANKRRRI
jgi:hypothetical protein